MVKRFLHGLADDASAGDSQAVVNNLPTADVAAPKRRAVRLEARVSAPHSEVIAEGVCTHGHILALVAQLFSNLCSHVASLESDTSQNKV